eukprot:639455-Prymnesium_polylepis.1
MLTSRQSGRSRHGTRNVTRKRQPRRPQCAVVPPPPHRLIRRTSTSSARRTASGASRVSSFIFSKSTSRDVDVGTERPQSSRNSEASTRRSHGSAAMESSV